MREIRVGSIQPLEQPRLYASGSQQPDPDLVTQKIEENVDLACRLLTRAGEAGCDIAAYPEDLQAIGHYLYYIDPSTFLGCVETVPGPTSDRIAEVARKHRMHVIYTQYERVGEKVYNAAVLIGRKGELIGKYHKVQMPTVERWIVTHGASFPVFETDFGIVGIMICYDIDFPEIARCLALNGAELLFCPTMGISMRGQCEGNGLMRVRMRAIDNFVPLAAAMCKQDSVIVDRDGSILAMARPGKEDVISAVIDLDAKVEDHSEWELITGLADFQARIMQERLPAVYSPLTTPRPPALERYRDTPMRPAPHPRSEFFEQLYRWWSEKG
jgi:predicted amidohydrolase